MEGAPERMHLALDLAPQAKMKETYQEVYKYFEVRIALDGALGEQVKAHKPLDWRDSVSVAVHDAFDDTWQSAGRAEERSGDGA